MVADTWHEYREQLRSLGERGLGAAATLLWDLRFSLVIIVLAGFGRAASEVGAVMIVGGNIDGVTRVMTTSIALETSKGDLPLALGPRVHPAHDRARAQRRRVPRQGDGAAPLRMSAIAPMRAPSSLLPLRLEDVALRGRGARRSSAASRRRIEAGPRTVILGPNGAGKSVLLRLCHGLLRPTAGTVRVEFPEVAGAPRRQAMVFQRPVMLRRSALGNVTYALRLAGVPRSQRRAARDGSAAAPSASRRYAQHAARVLSGGEQQRLALARVWALHPEVLFLDEPTANLDPGATHEIERIVGALHAAGTKIVMVTHNLGQAHRMGDEILFIHEGRLAERAPADRFLKRPDSPEAARFLEGELPW